MNISCQINMDYKNTVFTRQLDKKELDICFNEILDIFKYNKVTKVELLFGFAWGNEYKDWMPFTVPVERIINEIDKANQSGSGNFYNDDTFLSLNDFSTEILFCHEYDIHLSYNEPNELVNNILEVWDMRQIIHVKRINKQ